MKPIVAGAFVAAALLVGAAAVFAGPIALVLPAALAAVAWVVASPARALALAVVVLPMDRGLVNIGQKAISVSDLATGLVVVSLLIRGFVQGRSFKLPRVWDASLLFFVVAATSLLVARDLSLSLRYVVIQAKIWLLYLSVCMTVESQADATAMYVGFTISAAFQALLGFVQFFASPDLLRLFVAADSQIRSYADQARAFGSFAGDPNAYAGYLTILLGGVMALFSVSAPRMRRVTAVVLFAATGALVLALSRGPLVVVLAICGLALVAGELPKGLWAFVGGGLVLALILGSDSVADVVLQRFSNWSDTASTMRLTFWGEAWKVFLEHPWLGIGYNGFGVLGWQNSNSLGLQEMVMFSAHNLYLQLLASVGGIGLFSFFAVIGKGAADWLAAWRQLPKSIRSQVFWIAMGAVAFLLHGMVDVFLQNIAITGTFWCLLALLSRWDSLNPLEGGTGAKA